MARSLASSRGLATGRAFRVEPQVGGGGGQPSDPPPQIISGPTLVSRTTTSVTLTWTSDQFVQSWLQWGLTTSYGNETTHDTSFDYQTHSQVVTGLTAGTTYHFRPVVVNQVGLTTIGSDISVTTESSTVESAFDEGYTYTDHVVPTGAGWTDGTDCRSALQNLFNSIPSGTSATAHVRIIFPAGFTWRISGNVVISGKSHWTIEGSGTEATYGHTGGAIILRQGGLAKSDIASGHFSASHTGVAGYRATDIRFHCLTLRGDSTIHSTTATYTAAYAMGVTFRSCDGGRVSHCIIERVRGDCIYISEAQSVAPYTPSRDILIDGNLLQDNERMGLGIINYESTLTIRDNKFSDMMYAAIDWEPNKDAERVGNALVSGNLFADTMSWGSDYNDGVIKADSPAGPDHYGTIIIEDNTFSCNVLNNVGQGWMFAGTYGPAPYIKDGPLIIRNNTCTNPLAGPVVRGANWVGGITMQNNTGFKTASGSWFTNSGNNGTIINTGNT